MTLEDLAQTYSTAARLTVPSWALGTVRRRSITFATGVCDDSTVVHWVQAHSMTGDLRVHASRPRLSAGDPLDGLDRETLVMLASVEGGVATTSWGDGLMSWSGWTGFQAYDKYPEPGLIQRIGDCMIEFAPSGVYVEDWRFQKSEPGLLAGLTLLADVHSDGREYPRAGGLVIAGDHAICSIARRNELPEGTRAQDFVRQSIDPVAALRQVFDCTVDYAVQSDGWFVVSSSTDPRREGMPAAIASNFSQTSTPGIVLQKLVGIDGINGRLWRIESLASGVAFPLSTSAPADKLAWLEAEADTLITPHLHSASGTQSCA